MALVKIENLRKTYNKNTDGAVHALNGISLSIDNGEMIAIIGASGSGKSTLLHILSCLDKDFEGSYLLNGEQIKTLSASKLAQLRNHKIGIVLQNFGLIYDMSVFDNVAMPVYLSGEHCNAKELRHMRGIVL